MSNSAGSPSTLWRLRPAIYGAAQNYIASETSDAQCPGRDQGNEEEEE